MSGKAAYEAHKSAYDDGRHEWADPDDIIEWIAWERLPAFEQEAWEAAAAAGAAAAHERTAELVSEVNGLREQLNGVYRERAHLVAYLAAAYPSCIGPAPDAEGWAIVYIATPEQMTWHISYDDLKLFGHVHVGVDEWDGHTTAEKYARLDRLTARKAGAAVVTSGTEHLAKLIGGLAIGGEDTP